MEISMARAKHSRRGRKEAKKRKLHYYSLEFKKDINEVWLWRYDNKYTRWSFRYHEGNLVEVSSRSPYVTAGIRKARKIGWGKVDNRRRIKLGKVTYDEGCGR